MRLCWYDFLKIFIMRVGAQADRVRGSAVDYFKRQMLVMLLTWKIQYNVSRVIMLSNYSCMPVSWGLYHCSF
jgi:hypothetical protein